MAELQKISMADIKNSIGKGWIANMAESEIMQNPLLSRMVQAKDKEELGGKNTRTRISRQTSKNKSVVDLHLKCPRCQHAQHEYAYSLEDQPWFKCEACQQLSPSGAWIVMSMKLRGTS